MRTLFGTTVGLLALGAATVADPIPWRSAAEVEPAVAGQPADQLAALARQQAGARVTLQFDGPLTGAQRAALAESGVTLLAYLGNHAHFARLSPAGVDVADALAAAPLTAARPIALDHKLHPLIVAGVPLDWAVVGEHAPGDVIVGAYLHFHQDVDYYAEGLPALDAFNVRLVDELDTISAAVIELPVSEIRLLAADDRVQWIEPALPRMVELNAENRVLTQVDSVQTAPYALSGAGVSVLVYDGGYGLSSHGDFGGRHTTRDNSGLSDHATHVAGTVGGDGAGSGGANRGMAPGVTIESYGFDYDGTGTFLYTNPGDIQQDYGDAIALYGVDISNNSIGTNTETNGFNCAFQGDYGTTSNLIDSIVRGSLGAPFRVVWANGNERQGSRCDVEGHGDFYSTAPPAGAKNHIAVGAVNANDDSMTSFSSWGPVDDGRLKPDIVGPGCQSGGDGGVTSCGRFSTYTVKCGTSMASPTVCGIAALLLEDYRAQFPSLPDPRNSTLKVLFAHSAVDLGNPGPDYQFGYGSVRAPAAVDLLRAAQFTEDVTSQGETITFRANVAGGQPFKVTLAWDDFPGTPNVNPALVNDLDLVVTSPSGTRFYPWTLNPNNPSAAAVRTQEDHVNNIEQVLVDAPEAGAWTVEVVGTNVPQGPQPFSLAASDPVQKKGLFLSIANDATREVAPGAPGSVVVDILEVDESIVPGSETLHASVNGAPFVSTAMTALGGGLYQGELPAVGCDDTLDFYVSAEGAFVGPVTLPKGAPVELFTPRIGVTAIGLADDFETDQGWTPINLSAVSGVWQRGVPVDDQTWSYDPAADADGSGQCWLTQNTAGNSDVDGGAVQLRSPIFDLSGGQEVELRYDYFLRLTNTDGSDRLLVEISSSGVGGPWTTLATHDVNAMPNPLSWRAASFDLADLSGLGVALTDQMVVRFTVNDADPQSIVEAAVDGFRAATFACIETCLGDVDGSGAVDLDDLLLLLSSFGSGDGGDVDGDGDTDLEDLLLLLGAFGAPCA